jgi:hypothetical protein
MKAGHEDNHLRQSAHRLYLWRSVMIPDPIEQRLAERRARRPRVDRFIASGDVRRIASGDNSRLVFVVAVSPSREFAQVTLVHTYPEWATAADVIVDRSVSDVTYPLVVQTGMRGVVRLKNLGRFVTSLPTEVIAACLSSRMPKLIGTGLSTGTAFTGPLDARAVFKDAERMSLARFSHDNSTENVKRADRGGA